MSSYQRHNSTAASQASNASLPPAGNTSPDQAQSQHKRVYQACIPCRRRKVRCDLGPVDNPSDPPCVRCRRESKECYFSATRRKRKTDDVADPDAEDYVIRNGRKRLFTGEPSPPAVVVERRGYAGGEATAPAVAPGSGVRREPLRRPEPARSSVASTARTNSIGRQSDFAPNVPEDSNAQVENIEAQTVMRRGVYGTHDALDLLYKAATDACVSPDQPAPLARGVHADCETLANASPRYRPDAVTATSHERTTLAAGPVPPPPIRPTPSSRRDAPESRSVDTGGVKMEPAIDPALVNRDRECDPNSPGYVDAIKAWNRFRFVRAGWFSAQEAIEYIQ